MLIFKKKKVVFVKRALLVGESARGPDPQMILKFHLLFSVSEDV